MRSEAFDDTVTVFNILYLQFIYFLLELQGQSYQTSIDDRRALRIVVNFSQLKQIRRKAARMQKRGTEDRSHECIATSSGK